jgi:Amidohydrolase family
VLKHGGSLSFHSDMPMAPAKPLQLVWAGVNRLTYEGDVAGPKHKVPLPIAMKAITIDAAHSIQLEKQVGSIEVGKDANLTILDQNPAEVAPEGIKDIAVWGTMLEGRVQPANASRHRASLTTGAGALAVRQPDTSRIRTPDDHGHDHADGGCCSCAMNRHISAAMARTCGH